MAVEIKLSSKGQIVIPKDVRDTLDLVPGATLHLSCEGRRIVIEASEPRRKGISYDEFRRRVPRYTGAPATIEDMRGSVSELFAQRDRR